MDGWVWLWGGVGVGGEGIEYHLATQEIALVPAVLPNGPLQSCSDGCGILIEVIAYTITCVRAPLATLSCLGDKYSFVGR